MDIFFWDEKSDSFEWRLIIELFDEVTGAVTTPWQLEVIPFTIIIPWGKITLRVILVMNHLFPLS